MKIAIWHNLPSGGGYRAMYDQVRGLVSQGHHVEIWCPESAERDFLSIDDIALVHRRPLPASGHDVVRNRKMVSALRRYLRTRQALKHLDAHVQICASEINKKGFDVVLAHPSLLFYMHPLARYTHAPSVLFLQEIYRKIHEARPQLPWEALQAPAVRWSYPGYLRKCLIDVVDVHVDRIVLREECRAAREWDRILCNSYFSRESMVRAYGIDVHTCYLGVNCANFYPANCLYENYLVGVGEITSAKGIHLAIEALGVIPEQKRPSLRWIGNRAWAPYLAFCEQLAQAKGVNFIPEVRVSEDDLRKRLQCAIAMLYPPQLEPFGYAPLEANACGTPVIGIAEGGVRETVIDGFNGLLVSDRRPESWAKVILRLIEEPRLREILGMQGISWVKERWTCNDAAMRLEQELTECVAMGRCKEPIPYVYH